MYRSKLAAGLLLILSTRALSISLKKNISIHAKNIHELKNDLFRGNIILYTHYGCKDGGSNTGGGTKGDGSGGNKGGGSGGK